MAYASNCAMTILRIRILALLDSSVLILLQTSASALSVAITNSLVLLDTSAGMAFAGLRQNVMMTILVLKVMFA